MAETTCLAGGACLHRTRRDHFCIGLAARMQCHRSMTTTEELLVRYNELASQLEQPTVKTWKKKRADLEAAIADMEGRSPSSRAAPPSATSSAS